MQVLITGATGFLGSHVAEAFVQDGHTVRAAVRPTSDTARLRSRGVACRPASLDQPDALRAAMRDVEVVVHAAARVDQWGTWTDFVRDTVGGTRHALEAAAAAGVRRFIQISSVGVYGRPRTDHRPHDESSPCRASSRWSYYVRAKIEAENLVRTAHADDHLATTILRPTVIYGPRDRSMFPPLVAALRARRLKWIGSPDNRLSMIYVSEVARAVVLAATGSAARGQVYNVSADEFSPTQRELVTAICTALDLPPPTAAIPYPAAYGLGFFGECLAHATGFRVRPPITRLSAFLLGGQRRYDSGKIRRDLGWQPGITAEQGIRQTIEWFGS